MKRHENQSIKMQEQTAENARKLVNNKVAKTIMEISLSRFPSLEKSNRLTEKSIESTCYNHNYYMEDVDGTLINMADLMMPSMLTPKPVVKQVVPKHIDNKIENYFKESKKRYARYFQLKLYLSGGFTLEEVANYYSTEDSRVSKNIKQAKQEIIDLLTEEELSKCYWWLKVPRPKVKVTETYVFPVEVKPQPKQKHWLDHLFTAPTK
ncbi:hypothetical protein [Neobacillus kokaensis]|uniref:RNA polymerase sigma-70 region 4 domain-containing protein n=1 Tax=Neobacillus kokaensis TaxID=2759023 RepID=A0ABQ3MYY0_9BACI|nr:hypothetical protein [Neobacillus kokaensis]GHH96607.1 hypothetical protein AM1BK_01500 [Neobacillus kokaensis]